MEVMEWSADLNRLDEASSFHFVQEMASDREQMADVEEKKRKEKKEENTYPLEFQHTPLYPSGRSAVALATPPSIRTCHTFRLREVRRGGEQLRRS